MTTTATKTTTHIQAVRDAATQSMHRICYLLEISEEAYCWRKYHYGREWLCHYLKGDAYIADMLERSAIFWGWWKNEWTRRDQVFLQDAEHIIKRRRETRRKAWMALHNPKALASELHPHAAVLNRGYEEVMQEIMFGNQMGMV